ncbi:MAG TPA: TOBE domain-containing protein [Candidatus Dormibacteraeota bacterium]|nr:TOBE domain-containing protein [Candidatus Dormibacteraeota bacterium]
MESSPSKANKETFQVVSELVIRTAAGNVTSIITTGSVERMNLKHGDNVFAIIKATEVSIEKE